MKLGTTKPTAPHRCTNCGRLHDAATQTDEKPVDLAPYPGAVAVCTACGHIMIFADDLALRDPTPEEIRMVAGDPRILAIQQARREVPSLRRLAELMRRSTARK